MVLIIDIFGSEAVSLDNLELLLLHFDNLGSVTLLHLDLSLAQGLILVDIILVLTFEEGKLLVELLQGQGRLRVDILSNLLVLGSVGSLQSIDLVLQLLVLLLQSRHLRVCGGNLPNAAGLQTSKFIRQF